MPHYKCEICDITTTLKTNYNRHLKTKKHRNRIILIVEKKGVSGLTIQNNPAKGINNPVNAENNPIIIQNNPANVIKEYECIHCNTGFTMHLNKRRHEMYRCKKNPNFIDLLISDKNVKIKKLKSENESLEKEKDKLIKEKKELYKQVSVLLDKVGDTNIQNNIILNNYGKEDLTHITDKLKSQLLKIPYGAIPKMIEAIHFNDEKPENKNIMMPNKKDNLVKVFQGDKWVYKDKVDTISDLVDSKYTMMDTHFEELDGLGEVTSNIKTTYSKFRKFYDEGDEEMVERLKKECELVLLNNR
jgi:hypothetical protein